MFWEALKASKGLPVTDPLAALWGQKIAEGGAWQLTTITGTLPLTVLVNGKALTDYKIYGTSEGSGVRTKNLFDPNAKNADNGYIAESVVGYPNGAVSTVTWAYVTEYIPVDSSTKYVMFMDLYRASASNYARGLVFYDENKEFISAILGCSALTQVTYENPQKGRISFTTPKNCRYIRTNVDKQATMLMLVEASTPPPAYIPYGYKLPLTVTAGGATTDYPVYIGDSQLMEGEYVDYGAQKIYKLIDGVLTPTDPPVSFPEIALPKAKATIDIESELKPQAEVTGEIKEI